VEVRHDEGVASHIGPKPCVITREGVGEASVGEITGQPLSRVRIESGRRRCCEGGRQHDETRDREHLIGSAWSENLAREEASCVGTGRSQVRPAGKSLLVRAVKARSRNR
jgi:hypothetical protein